MEGWTKQFNQLRELILAVVALIAVFGLGPRDLTKIIDDPSQLTALQVIAIVVALFAVVLVIGSLVYRRLQNASRIKDPDALRLDPRDPKLLLGRGEDLDRIAKALDRGLVFLVGESGCGKSALLQAALMHSPIVMAQFVPVYIDLTEIDWDGLLPALRNRFRQALPEAEQDSFPVGNTVTAEELVAAFDLYSEKLGRRPLLLFDQFDDYAARHLHELQDPIRSWLPADEVAEQNETWRVLRDALVRGNVALLFACRKEDQGALDSLRFQKSLANLPLDRPQTGSALPIIEAVTNKSAPVVENPETTWPTLKQRLAKDLEANGAVLPQQLKLVLQGLRSLPRLTIGAYERANGIAGLEAASVRDAIASAERISELKPPQILYRVLQPLVDADRLPPGKNKPRSATELARNDLSAEQISKALRILGDRDVVRVLGDQDDKDARWQLDHDYLARPILRIIREQEKWQALLTEQARLYAGAGGNIVRRWHAMLSMSQQAGIFLARLRGKLRYGDSINFAVASALATVFSLGVPVVGLIGLAWIALQFVEAYRIEAALGGLQETSENLTQEQRGALLDLANGSWLVHWIVTPDTFTRPDEAAVFSQRPGEMFLALAGLSRSTASELITKYGTRTVSALADPRLQRANVDLLKVGGASVFPGDAQKTLASVLMAVQQTDIDSDQVSALAEVYAAVAAELPPEKANEMLAPVLTAMQRSNVGSDQLSALAKAYQAVAAKLPPEKANETLAPVLTAMQRADLDSDQLSALAKAYQAVAAKLPPEKPNEALDPVLKAMQRTDLNPDQLSALAKAYQVVAAKPQEKDARANEALAPVLTAMQRTDLNPNRLLALAEAYQAVAANLQEKDARPNEALAPVLTAMQRTDLDSDQLSTVARAYQVVASKLPEKDARANEALAAELTAILRTDFNRYRDFTALEAYQAVAVKLPQEKANGALDPILKAMQRTDLNASQLSALAKAYQAVAAKLPPEKANEALDPVLKAMQRTDLNPDQLSALAKAYQVVAAKLQEKDARANEALALVLTAMQRTDLNPNRLLALAEAYQAVAANLQEKDARPNEALAPVLTAMQRTNVNPNGLPALAEAYQAVAAKLPEKNARANEALAAILTGMLQRSSIADRYNFTFSRLQSAYQAVAAKLSPEKANETLVPVLTAMQRADLDSDQLSALAKAYQAVAAKLPPEKANEALDPVLKAMQRTDRNPGNPDQLSALAKAYQAVAGKLPEKDARPNEALAPVLTAMQRTDLDPNRLLALAEAYQAVTAKLPAESLRANQTLLNGLRMRASTPDIFLEISKAELMGASALDRQEATDLAMNLLSDPLSVEVRDTLLPVISAVLIKKDQTLGPAPENVIWAWLKWANQRER